MVVEMVNGDGSDMGSVEAVEQRVQLVNQQAEQLQSSAKSLAAAGGKGFHIEPEAAATLINACQQSITELDQLQQHMRAIQQSPKLGATPGARVVSPFTRNVAVDGEGIVPAIDNLITTLQDMISAYSKASTNYTETNERVQQLMAQQKAALA